MAILIVEDEADCREPLVDFLELAGYEVVAVDSGQAAIAALKTQKFDLVLCDITMPGITGFNVIDEVKRLRQLDTPFCFVTAKATDVDVLVGMKLGANDYIIKPYTLNRVLEVVRHFVKS